MRKLTISSLHRHRPHLPSAKVPHLRLTGSWLERAGFAPGASVEVRISDKQLVIVAK